MQRLAARLDEDQGLDGLWLTMSKRHHGHDTAVLGQVSPNDFMWQQSFSCSLLVPEPIAFRATYWC